MTNRLKAETDLQSLAQGSGETATLAKFALAQAKESDGIWPKRRAFMGNRPGNSPLVTPNSANLRLADVYNKQGRRRKLPTSFLTWLTRRGRPETKTENPFRVIGLASGPGTSEN